MYSTTNPHRHRGLLAAPLKSLLDNPLISSRFAFRLASSRTPLEAFTKTLRNEGPLAFYKGTAAPLVGVGSVYLYSFTHSTR